MTDEQSKAIHKMRERYLGEYKRINKTADKIKFFEEIRETAAAVGVSAWEKYAAATLYRLKGDPTAALLLLDEAIGLDPDFANPWNGKGNVLSDLKRYEEALDAYEKAISLDSDYAYPWNGKGNVLSNLKRYEEALDAYEKTISLDPDFANPWNGKGNILQFLKRYDEALVAYEKALSLDPEYATPWNGKGNILQFLKRYDEALSAYDTAISLDPECAPAWNGKGHALRLLKRYEEGLRASEHAAKLAPEFAASSYNLGLAYWGLKRPADTVKMFRRAIELGLEPEWKEAAESWIERANRIIELRGVGQSDEESTREDRSSDEALITDLFEAMKDDLPVIRKKKLEFKNRMALSVGRSRIVGTGAVDDMLLVLRDWNSYSPILRRDLRDQDGPGYDPGPDERLGGGYFIAWKGHGIAIDPGVDFVTQLYRKGLSIADVDTVFVTHCHLDHTRDLESLVDLNYRHNRAKGFKPHPPNDDFRQIQFRFCRSANMKYSDYLINSGCCLDPLPLQRGGGPNSVTPYIDVLAVPAQHHDINGRDNEAIGLVFVLKGEDGAPFARVGITSDSKWIESLSAWFKDCNVVVAHLGTIEVGDEQSDGGKESDGGGFLRTDLPDHLGTKGCFRLLQRAKPTVFVIGEFGEELVQTRFKILQVFNKLKPDETQFVLGGDSNLAIGLGKDLSVYCSHRECAPFRTRIPLDLVRPVLGDDFLFQYICQEHGLNLER